MLLLVIGLSHHSSPVTVRERFAFAESAVPGALQELRASGLAREAVILSTCNRVEIYAVSDLPDSHAAARLQQFLLDYHKLPGLPGGEMYAHAGRQGLEHLFKVACGLDSMVVGETEILGQLK
jgi:glutamyl-tRNA reductase